MKKLYKKLTRTLGTAALILSPLLITSAFAQQTYTYLFSSTPFNSVPLGGPMLETIGVSNTPINAIMPASTCPDTPSINLTYFENNAGFKAKAFFTDNYSIEMIFKFQELTGYNRIIDFSNSASDYGIYTLSTCLNFYPYGNVGTCPGAFDTTNYKQIVITRNGISKEMNVYVNGTLFTSYVDAPNYYVIGAAPNDSIKFFRDDNAVPNEASSGHVALVRMCDYILSPADVDTSYNNFCNRITGIESPSNYFNINIYPNPAFDHLNIMLPNTDFSKDINFTLINMIGQQAKSFQIKAESTDLKLSTISPGIYFYHLQIDHKIIKSGKIIIE